MSIAIYKKLERIEALLLEIKDDTYKGWVCEEDFEDKTKINTPSKRCKFRMAHPELVRANGGKYIYNLKGYFELFKNI